MPAGVRTAVWEQALVLVRYDRQQWAADDAVAGQVCAVVGPVEILRTSLRVRLTGAMEGRSVEFAVALHWTVEGRIEDDDTERARRRSGGVGGSGVWGGAGTGGGSGLAVGKRGRAVRAGARGGVAHVDAASARAVRPDNAGERLGHTGRLRGPTGAGLGRPGGRSFGSPFRWEEAPAWGSLVGGQHFGGASLLGCAGCRAGWGQRECGPEARVPRELAGYGPGLGQLGFDRVYAAMPQAVQVGSFRAPV